jgi:hypothetical protein
MSFRSVVDAAQQICSKWGIRVQFNPADGKCSVCHLEQLRQLATTMGVTFDVRREPSRYSTFTLHPNAITVYVGGQFELWISELPGACQCAELAELRATKQ